MAINLADLMRSIQKTVAASANNPRNEGTASARNALAQWGKPNEASTQNTPIAPPVTGNFGEAAASIAQPSYRNEGGQIDGANISTFGQVVDEDAFPKSKRGTAQWSNKPEKYEGDPESAYQQALGNAFMSYNYDTDESGRAKWVPSEEAEYKAKNAQALQEVRNLYAGAKMDREDDYAAYLDSLLTPNADLSGFDFSDPMYQRFAEEAGRIYDENGIRPEDRAYGLADAGAWQKDFEDIGEGQAQTEAGEEQPKPAGEEQAAEPGSSGDTANARRLLSELLANGTGEHSFDYTLNKWFATEPGQDFLEMHPELQDENDPTKPSQYASALLRMPGHTDDWMALFGMTDDGYFEVPGLRRAYQRAGVNFDDNDYDASRESFYDMFYANGIDPDEWMANPMAAGAMKQLGYDPEDAALLAALLDDKYDWAKSAENPWDAALALGLYTAPGDLDYITMDDINAINERAGHKWRLGNTNTKLPDGTAYLPYADYIETLSNDMDKDDLAAWYAVNSNGELSDLAKWDQALQEAGMGGVGFYSNIDPRFAATSGNRSRQKTYGEALDEIQSPWAYNY